MTGAGVAWVEAGWGCCLWGGLPSVAWVSAIRASTSRGGRWSSYPLIRFPMTKYEPADLRFALGLELIVLSLHES